MLVTINSGHHNNCNYQINLTETTFPSPLVSSIDGHPNIKTFPTQLFVCFRSGRNFSFVRCDNISVRSCGRKIFYQLKFQNKFTLNIFMKVY